MPLLGLLLSFDRRKVSCLGFSLWAWVTSVVFKMSACNRPSESHTSNGCFMAPRVYFSIFFLLSGVVLCGGNCLLRSTEKETARQR